MFFLLGVHTDIISKTGKKGKVEELLRYKQRKDHPTALGHWMVLVLCVIDKKED
jgi:hypothetical protein